MAKIGGGSPFIMSIRNQQDNKEEASKEEAPAAFSQNSDIIKQTDITTAYSAFTDMTTENKVHVAKKTLRQHMHSSFCLAAKYASTNKKKSLSFSKDAHEFSKCHDALKDSDTPQQALAKLNHLPLPYEVRLELEKILVPKHIREVKKLLQDYIRRSLYLAGSDHPSMKQYLKLRHKNEADEFSKSYNALKDTDTPHQAFAKMLNCPEYARDELYKLLFPEILPEENVKNDNNGDEKDEGAIIPAEFLWVNPKAQVLNEGQEEKLENEEKGRSARSAPTNMLAPEKNLDYLVFRADENLMKGGKHSFVILRNFYDNEWHDIYLQLSDLCDEGKFPEQIESEFKKTIDEYYLDARVLRKHQKVMKIDRVGKYDPPYFSFDQRKAIQALVEFTKLAKSLNVPIAFPDDVTELLKQHGMEE